MRGPDVLSDPVRSWLLSQTCLLLGRSGPRRDRSSGLQMRALRDRMVFLHKARLE